MGQLVDDDDDDEDPVDGALAAGLGRESSLAGCRGEASVSWKHVPAGSMCQLEACASWKLAVL